MPYVAEGDLIFHHRQRLAEVHAHSAHISHVGQRTGDQGLRPICLSMKKFCTPFASPACLMLRAFSRIVS